MPGQKSKLANNGDNSHAKTHSFFKWYIFFHIFTTYSNNMENTNVLVYGKTA